jgi:uncharacterized protein (TIGR00661 family)
VLCNAGFETPAEALFLKKKLCVIPMHGQYEQQCNAFALKQMGVPVLPSLTSKEGIKAMTDWLKTQQDISVTYTDQTNRIIDMLIEKYRPQAKTPQFAFPAFNRI